MHLPGVDAAGGHRHGPGHGHPVLLEVQALHGIRLHLVQPEGVVVAGHHVRVALQLADHRPGVNVVHAGQPHPLADHAEADAVRLLPGVGAVAGAVQVQDHPVGPGPLRHRLDGGVPDGQVDHYDDAAEVPGELGALVHVLHGGRGHVHVVALDLAGLRLGPVDRLDAVQEPVTPAHERLGVDVLVVLGEVQAAAQRLVDHPAVVARRQPQLRFGRGAEQRAPVLVQVLPLHHDAVRRPLERLGVVRRDAHVLQPQRLQRLEPEHVADDRRGQVRYRSLLEQVEVIRDVRDVLALTLLACTGRHRVDAVALGLVVLVIGQPVGPHHRPGRGRRLARDRGARLLGRHARLRRDAERAEHVRRLRLVVRLPVPHLGVRDHSRCPPVGHLRSRCWVTSMTPSWAV